MAVVISYPVGISLILLGIIVIIVGVRRSRAAGVSANYGSVAVGGNNSGVITNTNSGGGGSGGGGGHQLLTIIGIIVELVGIFVTCWHAYHLAHLATK